ELESVIDLMYALIRLVSERSGVATSLIVSRDGLLDYIEHPERSSLREGWRFELVGTLMDDLLQGNIGLTVKDGALEIL
ncbi:MAG: ribonuclease D, partial [Collinsella intestinalis]